MFDPETKLSRQTDTPNSMLKTYVVHVKSAFEREKHIRSQLPSEGLDLEFVLEGDLPDLDVESLSEYFEGEMLDLKPTVSCTYKHFKIAERMVRDNVDLALVLEDDMILYKGWMDKLDEIIREARSRKLSRFLISLEDSSLKYPKGSERSRDQLLYQKETGRNTGAYLIDLDFAKATSAYLKHTKCSTSIGLHHNLMSESGVFEFYWAHPPIAVQGTATGLFATTISKNRSGVLARINWFFQRTYKQILYRLR